ncbi:MAG TPA: hypothetical protein DEH02_03365 [Bacteroidales bacterium]|nr:MAG: hypothetical protein A2X01_00670 [Bacteroidetes bacterium GWF2_35_48]HBX50089.1 hypothetical protein [Bacteroidales bacterium]
MKKILIAVAVSSLLGAAIFSGCQSSAEKVKDAEDNVMIANQELNRALADSIYKFRKDADEKIKAHEQSVSDFKARIAKEKKENRIQYETRLAEIEKRNSDLKKKLDDYKEVGKEHWENFKKEFSREMNDLSEAYKDLYVIK